MAVYVAVYVLPSWIENMLTDWDDFAHVWMRTPTHTCVSELHTTCACKYTLTHLRVRQTLDPLEIDSNVTMLTNVNTLDSLFQDCWWVQSFSFVGPHKSWHVAIDQGPNQSINWHAVDEQVKFQADKCQHALYRTLKPHCYLFVTPSYGSQIFLIAYRLHTPFTTPLHSLPPCPRPEQARMAVGGPWESGLGWGPLTNTQPNVLIDPMPSYFRTSVRRQGEARRDQQSASLKELEQGGGGGRVHWRRGQRWVHSTPPRRSTRRQGAQVQLCNTEWCYREGVQMHRMNECVDGWLDGRIHGWTGRGGQCYVCTVFWVGLYSE